MTDAAETDLEERAETEWRDLAPHIIRQRLIIEATTDEIVGPDLMKNYLFELANVTKMQVLSGPYVYSAHELGWGGWIHCRTSGANAYSYPERNEGTNKLPPLFTVDTYTCKPFSVKDAVKFTRDYIKPIELVYKEL